MCAHIVHVIKFVIYNRKYNVTVTIILHCYTSVHIAFSCKPPMFLKETMLVWTYLVIGGGHHMEIYYNTNTGHNIIIYSVIQNTNTILRKVLSDSIYNYTHRTHIHV